MKVAIVTIHNANNYGAVFQAFALQEVISRYAEVAVVNYENRHVSRSFDLIRFVPSFHGLLGTGKDILRVWPRYIVINKFMRFISSHMKLTKRLTYNELYQESLERFDCYVAGSDQIWNPECISQNGKLDPVYFLGFAPVGARKISYASSFGAYNFADHEKEKLKELLDSFKMISVREERAKFLLQELLKRKVNHVLDPTLLLSRDEWLKSIGLPVSETVKERYILLYTVPKAPLIRNAVDFFSKKLGLKVITIDQGLSAGARVDKHIKDAGPLEFLKLFSEADFVITDSFHGVCFSLNFGKSFVAISPGKYANRIESLLSLVGLSEKIVNCEADLSDFIIDSDFTEAYRRLVLARQQSIDVLCKSLEVY